MAKGNSKTASAVSAWKRAPEPKELPSGNMMIVKRVGLRAFLTKGLIPNSLMTVVQSSLETGVSDLDEKQLMRDIFADPTKLDEFMGMLDGAVMFCAVQPRVHATPLTDDGEIDEGGKDLEKLYVDELDENDKMAIFQYGCGEIVDLEQFRS